MKRILFTLATIITLTTLEAKVGDNLFIGGQGDRHLVVHNRVLANVNGKPITVVDVMKKMDIMFYQQFPEFTESVEARHQFYTVNWKRTFDDLVDKELILADAEENKMPISNGDVRQEMESLFGPNIIANLDKINLAYDQAFEMIRGDIMLRRMLYFRVNIKAMRKVTPQVVWDAYQKYVKDKVRPSQFTYQVISIRNPDASIGAQAADIAHQFLQQENSISELKSNDETTKINISEEFVQNDTEVNPTHLEVLKTLGVGSFSAPVKQQSRADNSMVYRIFYLKDKKEGGIIPYQEVEKKIQDILTNDAIEEESESYIKKLRTQFGLKEKDLVPEDFQPFTLE